MTLLPDGSHPIWKLLNGLVSLAALGLWIWHVHHGGSFDVGDGAGVVGGLSALNLGRLFWKGMA